MCPVHPRDRRLGHRPITATKKKEQKKRGGQTRELVDVRHDRGGFVGRSGPTYALSELDPDAGGQTVKGTKDEFFFLFF